MSQPDRALALAEFLHQSRGMDAREMMVESARRWPDITREEVMRASEIATELVEAEAAEHRAEAAALRAELARRRMGR